MESFLYRQRRLSGGLALAISALLSIGGCVDTPRPPSGLAHASYLPATPSRTTHTVVAGETVYHIAHRYGVSVASVMRANALSDPRELRVGQMLVIPRGDADLASVSTFAPGSEWTPQRADREFAWPVASGVVSSPFGMRNGVMHEGVDIAAPVGTAVDAAADGTVIFAGRLHGYGNVVILQHSDGYATVYGHNERNLVKDGERVTCGEEIAEIGTSGRTSGPNLHFEVRRDDHAQNPLAYLPSPRPAGGISFARLSGS